MNNAAVAKIKAQGLRDKKKEELLKQMDHLKVELSQLRITKVTGATMASKLSKIMSRMQIYHLCLHCY